MAKSSGTTRNRQASSGIGSMRLGSYNAPENARLYAMTEGTFFLPVWKSAAADYEKVTNSTLPSDAVAVVFGRGAANGDDFENTLALPEYSNLKKYQADVNGENVTYVSGFDSEAQMRKFSDDTQRAAAGNRYNRMIRAWNRR